MGPKQRKRETSSTDVNKRKEESNLEQLEEIAQKDVDPYAELRYTPQATVPPPRGHDQKVEKVSVLRKRRAPNFISSTQTRDAVVSKPTPEISRVRTGSKQLLKNKCAQNSNILNINAISSKPLLKWYSPGELPIIPPPIEVLRRTPKISSTYTHLLDVSFKKEDGLLRLFKAEKRRELRIENQLMQKTGKSRQSLLLRKQQHLPHIGQTGNELSCMRVERTLTPEIICGRNIFSESFHGVREKNGLRRTLTRQERGYTVVTDWVGYPQVTDIIAQQLNLKSDAFNLAQSMSEDILPLEHGKEFVPRIEELGVVGLPYENVQKQLKEMSSRVSKFAPNKQSLSIELGKFKIDGTWETNRGIFGQEDMVSCEESKSGLAIGQSKLFWTQDTERSKKKWVIDLGCVAEIGKDSLGSITMTNIGTTAIHFKWEKVQPTNVFQLKKYDLRRFVFDHWGSVILPGDTFRIPVLYKCIEPGFYSEDWLLKTQPVMENGAEIITRLWGITRQYDPYHRVRQEIDEELEKRMARAIVEHRVTKIVDYLNLKEVPLKDTRFPLVHLGPDLFHLNNPWLKYHCASVYRLGKLAIMIDNKRGDTQYTLSAFPGKSAMSLMLSDVMDSASEVFLRSKFSGHEELADQQMQQDETTFISVEDRETANKYEPTSDSGSIYSDEEDATSISHIKRMIEELISPDIPAAAAAIDEPPEDENDYVETLAKSKRPLAINLTNPDFSVDQLRENILTNSADTQEQKEAQFLIMSEQVSRLLFRTDMPLDNWKIVIARTLLCSAMDSFSQFADSLKKKCCEGQMLQQNSGETEDNSEMLEHTPVEEEHSDTAESSTEHTASLAEIIEMPPSCLDAHARRSMQYLRYEDQYYSRLVCRMYSLLSYYVDSLDNLLSEVKKLKLTQEEIGFTRVRNIPMNFSVEELLSAPLPPNWVMLAQRMDNTVQKNHARKEALHDGM